MNNNVLELVMRLRDEASDKMTKAFSQMEGASKKAKSAVEQASDSLNKTGSASDKASTSVASLAKGFAGAQIAVDLFYKSIELAKEAVGFFLGSAMDASRVQELEYALGAMARANGLSNDEVFNTVGQLENLNIASTEARSAVARLISSNIDLSSATKLARTAQDLAVVGAMDSSDAFNTLTQAISSNEVMLLRQFGITKTQDQIFRDYAESIGRSGGGLKNLSTNLTDVEKKQAFLNAIFEQGGKVTGVYEDAMNSASKKMRSLEGRVIPDLKIAIGEAFRPATEVIVGELYGALSGLKKWFDANQDAVKAFGQKLASAVRGGISVLKKIGKFFADHPVALKILIGAVAGLAIAFAVIGVVIGVLIAKAVLLATGITIAMVAIGAKILLIGAIIGAVVTLIVSYWDQIVAFIQGIVTAITTFISNLLTSIQNVINGVVEFVTGIITAIQEFFTNLIAFLNPIIQVIQGIAEFIGLVIRAILAVVIGVFGLIFATIFNTISLILFGVVIPIFTQVYEFISAILATIWDVMVTVWNGIKTTVETVLNSVKAVITTILNAVWGFISPWLTKVWNNFKQAFDTVAQVVNEGITKAKDWLTEKMQGMLNKAIEIKDRIVGAFKDLASGVMSALRSIKFPHISLGEGSASIAGKEIKYPKINVDWYEQGGWVNRTGLAVVHQGEFVLSRDMLAGAKNIPQQVSNTLQAPINVNAVLNNNMDAYALAQVIGREVNQRGRY